MTHTLQNAVRRLVDAHGGANGLVATSIQGVYMMRAYVPTVIMGLIYKPLTCLRPQGAKQVTVGTDADSFAAGQSAIVSADVPVVSRITQASRAEPYPALAVDLSAQIGGSNGGSVATPAVLMDDTDVAATDCVLRLVKLLERPKAIPTLRPLIVRGLHYRLLTGRHGRAVSGLACLDGIAQRIVRAVAVL